MLPAVEYQKCENKEECGHVNGQEQNKTTKTLGSAFIGSLLLVRAYVYFLFCGVSRVYQFIAPCSLPRL